MTTCHCDRIYIALSRLPPALAATGPNTPEARVIGFQWSWRFEYPEGFSSTALYLPVNKQAFLKMKSVGQRP